MKNIVMPNPMSRFLSEELQIDSNLIEEGNHIPEGESGEGSLHFNFGTKGFWVCLGVA